MEEPTIYQECSVQYTHVIGFFGCKEFKYKWQHRQGEEGERTIYVLGDKLQFLILLDYWNSKSKDYKYYSIGE